jgi:hypothetical protein
MDPPSNRLEGVTRRHHVEARGERHGEGVMRPLGLVNPSSTSSQPPLAGRLCAGPKPGLLVLGPKFV